MSYNKRNKKMTSKSDLGHKKIQKPKSTETKKTLASPKNSLSKNKKVIKIAEELGKMSNNLNKIIESCTATVTELKKENNIIS